MKLTDVHSIWYVDDQFTNADCAKTFFVCSMESLWGDG